MASTSNKKGLPQSENLLITILALCIAVLLGLLLFRPF